MMDNPQVKYLTPVCPMYRQQHAKDYSSKVGGYSKVR
jgi:hypothetical protein